MINNYIGFINENPDTCRISIKCGVIYNEEDLKSLDKFAMEKGHDSFNKLIDHLNTMTPEEICSTYK